MEQDLIKFKETLRKYYDGKPVILKSSDSGMTMYMTGAVSRSVRLPFIDTHIESSYQSEYLLTSEDYVNLLNELHDLIEKGVHKTDHFFYVGVNEMKLRIYSGKSSYNDTNRVRLVRELDLYSIKNKFLITLFKKRNKSLFVNLK